MSYFKGIIKNSAKEISKVLGKYNKSKDIKTQREWWSETPEAVQFCVYDYYGHNIKLNEVYNYHIGTLTKEDTDKVITYLKECGLNATYDNKF